MKIRDAFYEFILACEADNASRKTISWYQEQLNRGPYNPLDWLSNHGRAELADVTTSDLRQYIAWMKAQPNAHNGKERSPYTVNATVRCLHRFWNWCHEEYGITNPMKGRIKYPKNPPPDPKAIRLETAIALILSCGDDLKGVRDRALLMFFLSTGTRREGVATLTMDRLDLQRRFAITHEKGNKHHLKPFDPLTADAINEWIKIREPEAALFYNLRTRKALTGSGIRTIISKIALANGIEGKTNPHGWRHLFALLYHQAGGSIASLSKLLGHANSKITAEAYLNFAMETAFEDYERLNPMQRVADALKQHEDERSGDSKK